MVDLQVFGDKLQTDHWRVEYFDDEGSCFVTVFSGQQAEARARAYHDALSDRTVNCAECRASGSAVGASPAVTAAKLGGALTGR
jgi:hypothetical protein